MTELRDARLRKAMEQAPDAQLQPHARTREAILAAARGAVQPAWKRWWPRNARSGLPWAAAFATVAMATLLTLMWQGQEAPGSREETQVAVAPPAAAPEPAPTPTPATAPSPAPAPAPATPPAPAAAPAPAPLPAPATAAAPPTAAAPVTGSARATRSAPRTRSAPDAQAPVLADAAPAAADATARPAAPEARSAAPAAPAAAPVAEPAPPALAAAPAAPAPRPPTVAMAAPEPQAAQPAPSAAPRAALRAAPSRSMWTQVRIEAGGRSVVVPTAQAGRLPSLLSRVLVSPGEPGGAAGSASLRLELARGDDDLGVLELVDGRWRWTPLRNTQQARLLQVDAELSEAVRAEAEFLLRR